MKQTRLLYLLLIITLYVGHAAEGAPIIPRPTSLEYGKGTFELKADITIIAPDNMMEAHYLARLLEKGFGKKPKINATGKGITLLLDKRLSDTLGNEGYMLDIGNGEIILKAAGDTGIFYGIQSMRQLLPTDFEYGTTKKSITVPALKIMDKPRFPWRAFMLDESRHFQGATEVKRLLDQMALLKMNTFHWHLTDDQGWRIEIKKYPKLTTVGSVRSDTQAARKSEERTGEPHKGFYTQAEIRDILKYAADRHINVVPEIEMPGHATAAIAAYPWLGSLGTTKEVSVTFGKLPDSYNIADPKVVRFLKDVLTEVIALFPGEIVHIGGDEVNFGPWEKSSTVQSFMKEQQLRSPVDLQIYFTNKISNFIDGKGKRMMGWNEIMGDDIHGERTENTVKTEQKLAKSAIVHFWKGDLELINTTVQAGYDVVNSNHWDTYLDYTYERIPLSTAYSFDPVPKGLDPKYHSRILGTGAQMWTEWLPTKKKLEKQIFPRLAAYAEVGWTNRENKDFERFQASLRELKERWTMEGISFMPAQVPPTEGEN